MRTCLEIRSMDARHEMEVRSDYQRTNQYNASHPDALATGDWQGKGTGHPGHSHWLPDCTLPTGLFNYSNFDTAYESHAGNGDERTPNTDNWARLQMMTRSLYSSVNQYSENIIDTSANVEEGQYVESIASMRARTERGNVGGYSAVART